MGSVGVVVDTTVEDGSCILSNSGADQSLSTGVLLDEVCDIMNNTGDGNKSSAVLGLGLVAVPVDDGELFERNAPVESLPLLVELLLQLLEAPLLNLVLLELLEIKGETELLPDPDRPLGGIILMPFDGVAVIRGKLMVEVVVTLS